MNWEDVERDEEKRRFAMRIVDLVPDKGWRIATLEHASADNGLGLQGWRKYWPGGVKDVIWYISEVSDESMRKTFECNPTENMAEVIIERFSQNSELKPFVRKVMFFDFLHPFQAVRRMQRTVHVMFSCLSIRKDLSYFRLVLLNAVYTLLVFVWLNDNFARSSFTISATRKAMRLLGFD